MRLPLARRRPPALPEMSAVVYVGASALVALASHVLARGGVVVPHGRILLPYGIPAATLALAVGLAWLTREWPARARRWTRWCDLGSSMAAMLLLGASRDRPVDAPLVLSVVLMLKTAVGLIAVGMRAPSAARAGWLLCGIAFAFYVAPFPWTRAAAKLKGDEPHYVLVTMSLLRDGNLYLDPESSRASPLPFIDGHLTDGHTAPARGGRVASWHEVGLSLLLLLPYWLGGWKLAILMMASLAALTIRELYRATSSDPRVAFAVAILIGFSPPFAVYATQLYPEIPGALCTIYAARQMIARRGDYGGALRMGVALAALPWLQFRFWALALPMTAGALMLWPVARARVALVFPLAISTVGYSVLLYGVYGRITLTPLFLRPDLTLQGWPVLTPTSVAMALLRPWLDGYDGLVLLAPVFLCAVVGLLWLCLLPDAAGRVLVVTVLAYSGFIGLWYLRGTSGDSPPGRYMVVVLPLLGLALGKVMEGLSWWRAVGPIVPLAALGFAATLVSLWQPLLARYPYGGEGGAVAVLSRVLSLPLNLIAVTASPLVAVSTTGVVLLLLLRWYGVPPWAERPDGSRRPPRHAVP